jgi:hypothetical protein
MSEPCQKGRRETRAVVMDKETGTKKSAVLARTGKELLEELIKAFGRYPDVIPYQELQGIADKLSAVARKTARPWTWRYLRSVLSGTVEPSQLLVDTMMRLGALVDGAPVEAVTGERVTVLALGRVEAGAVILADSVRCANPACRVVFVPRVPWQKCHSGECAREVRKIRANSSQLTARKGG